MNLDKHGLVQSPSEMNSTGAVAIVVSTRNRGKFAEFTDMFSMLPFQLLSLDDFPNIIEVEEVGTSFRENAVLKAKGYAAQTGLLTLADDSGLEVSALSGAPGIFSARYGGVGASDLERTVKLLEALSLTKAQDRSARFVSVIAIFDPRVEDMQTFEGVCKGQIAYEPEGTNGFGYDPIFVPNGFSSSFGCLDSSIKKRISHRGRAMHAAQRYLHYLGDGVA